MTTKTQLEIYEEKLDRPLTDAYLPLTRNEAIEYLMLRGATQEAAEFSVGIGRGEWEPDVIITGSPNTPVKPGMEKFGGKKKR